MFYQERLYVRLHDCHIVCLRADEAKRLPNWIGELSGTQLSLMKASGKIENATASVGICWLSGTLRKWTRGILRHP